MDPTLSATGATGAAQSTAISNQLNTIQENLNLFQQFNDQIGAAEIAKSESSFQKDAKIEIANLIEQAGQRMAQG
jgi:predicted kinase